MRRPRFIAEHARDARGPVGRLIAFIMARETWAQNVRAIEALGVGETDHVLDVGCGHGRSLATLAARAPKGRVLGADPSELMTEIAIDRNRALVKAGRVGVSVAGVEALPFPDCAFDKALCVHVLYFWEDLDVALREIARVLKSGGRLALLFRTGADAAAVQNFPAEVYRFPAFDEVIVALGRVGFVVDTADELRGERRPEPVLLLAVKPSGSAGS